MEPETLPPNHPPAPNNPPAPESPPPRADEQPSKRPVWMRGLFMLLLMVAFGIAQGFLWILAIVQFLWLMFADEPNAFLSRFGRSLSLWLAETTRFVSCASDIKPFPWSAWPPSD